MNPPAFHFRHSAVIVLHYGNPDLTRACIAAFHCPQTGPEVVLIDNDPDHRCPVPPDIGILYRPQPRNLGFAAGVNTGLQEALARDKQTVLLLNNDVTASRDAICRLLDHARKSPGLYGAIEYGGSRPGQDIHFAGADFVWRETALRIQTQPPSPSDLYPTRFVRGSCMAMPLDLVRDIGFLDESLWSYAEDADFCLRARAAGYGLWIDPQVQIHHALSRGAAPCIRNYLMARNHVLLALRHTRGLTRFKTLAWGGAAALASLVRPSRAGKFPGFLAGIRQTPGLTGRLIHTLTRRKHDHETS